MKKRKVQIVIYFAPQNNKKQFLLLKTNKRRGSFWQNVTGGVEDTESFEQGALREVLEETALKEQNIEKLVNLEMDFNFTDQWNNEVTERVFILKLKTGKIDIKIDSSEHQDFRWESNMKEIKELIKYKSNIEAIQKAQSIH